MCDICQQDTHMNNMSTENEATIISEVGMDNSLELGCVGKFNVKVEFSDNAANGISEDIREFMQNLVVSQMEERYGKK